MTYTSVKHAAEVRMGGDSTGAWVLADALLAEIPPAPMGPTPESHRAVPARLADLADALAADGIETPQGNAYTANGLRDLRNTAMAWPEADRQRLAAFRTHDEVGADPWRRSVLAALCTAARSQVWDEVPDTVDPDAWGRAVASVQRKVATGTRYPVSVNDWRTAAQRAVNVPVSTRGAGDMRDAIAAVAEVRRLSVYAVKILAANPQPTGEWLEALGGFADTLRMLAGYVDTLVSGGGVTDESLEALLAGEGR